MNKYLAYLAFFVISLGLTSCSFYRMVTGKGKYHDKKIVLAGSDSSKVVASVPPPPIVPKPDTVVKTPDSLAPPKQLIAQLAPYWKKRLVYKTFSGKAKMHFEGPEGKQEFTAHIRLRRDSVIWINITAALGGISVARVFVTQDSIFMVNYLEKEVVRIPLSRAAKILPAKVDFASLQNLIIGEPLRDGAITDAVMLNDSCMIQVEDSSYIQHLLYNKADSSLLAGRMGTHDPNGPKATTRYSSYISTPNGRISSYRVLDLLNGNEQYSLDMNFSRIDFDQPLEYPFSIPDSYTLKPE